MENYAEFYKMDRTLILSHCVQGFVGSLGVLTLNVITGRKFCNRCLINNFKKQKFICDTTNKTDQKCDLEIAEMWKD